MLHSREARYLEVEEEEKAVPVQKLRGKREAKR